MNEWIPIIIKDWSLIDRGDALIGGTEEGIDRDDGLNGDTDFIEGGSDI